MLQNSALWAFKVPQFGHSLSLSSLAVFGASGGTGGAQVLPLSCRSVKMHAFFFIAASVVRCTADRANDDIVIFRKRLVAHGTLDAFVVQNRTSKIRLAIFKRRSEYCQNYFLIHIILQNARNRNAKRANFQTVNNSVRKRSKTSRKANIKYFSKTVRFPAFFLFTNGGLSIIINRDLRTFKLNAAVKWLKAGLDGYF